MGSILSSAFGGGAAAAEPATDSGGPVTAVRSKASWDERLEANRRSGSKLMVVDFSASWCGPCHLMAPVVKGMACRYTDVVFVKIDVDELSEVAKEFRIQAMPTFVLVKEGKEVSRVLGAKKDELLREIEHHHKVTKTG